jgi:very-short-patch-repair endonuclease
MKKVRKHIKDIKWDDVQIDNDNGLSKKQIRDKYDISISLLNSAEIKGIIKLVNFLNTEERRENLSKSIKRYLKENPDKHVWKRNSKFKSKPCEIFKEQLKKNNISFIEEYTPLIDRAFSIDIAFPDKKIGIEINGNQHYNADGTFKKYYQDRHELIESFGWKLYEYHFSVAFNLELINKIIDELKSTSNLSLVDYTFYIKKINKEKEDARKEKKYNICKCGKKKYKTAQYCAKCKSISRRVCERPPVDILLKEIEVYGYLATGKKYGVSDNAIRKWVKIL